MFVTPFSGTPSSTSCGGAQTSSGGGKSRADSATHRKAQVELANPVDTILLRRGPFRSQLISNGKLRAQQKSDLRLGSCRLR